MKITIQNLNGITGPVSVDIQNHTYLSGPNGSGKSSLAKVPYYILTGKGLKVKNGMSQAMAEMTLMGYTITRTSVNGTDTLYLNGNKITATALSKELSASGMNLDFFCEVFRPEVEFSDSTIIKMVNMNINDVTVRRLIAFSDAPDVKGESAETMFNDYITSNPINGIEAIEKAYKYFYTTRTSAKKELSSVKATLDAIPKSDKSTEELEAQRKEIVENKEKTSQELFRIRTEYEGIAGNNKRKTVLHDKVIQLKASLAGIDQNIAQKTTFSAKKAQFEKNLTAIKEEIATTEQLKRDITLKPTDTIAQRLGEVQTKWGMLSKQLEDITNTVYCPLSSGTFVCKQDKSELIADLKGDIDVFKAETERLRYEKEKIDDENKKAQDLKTRYDQTLSDLRSEMQSIQNELSTVEHSLLRIEEYEKQRNSVVADLESATAEMNAIKVFDSADLSNQIAALETKCKELNTEDRVLYDQIKSGLLYEHTEQMVNQASEKVSNLEFLVSRLKAVPQIIFEKITQPLQDAGNQVLSVLKPDWKIVFEPSKNGILIKIISDTNGEVARNDLSTGEQVILNYLLKNIGCQLTGFDTILVDNLDTLDKENTKALMDCIKASPYKTLCISSIRIADDYKEMFALVDWYK